MNPKSQSIQDLIIKIKFNQSVFNLGKGIDTYSKLLIKIKQRFTDQITYSISSNEIVLSDNNFIDVLFERLKNGQKSIKLILQQLKLQDIKKKQTLKIIKQQQQKKVNANVNMSMNVNCLSNNTNISKTKKYSFDPLQFQDELQKKQQIKQHDNQRIKSSEQNNQKVDLESIKIQVCIQPERSSFKKQKDQQYYWQCVLLNKGQNAVPKPVYVRDLTTHKLIEINGFQLYKSVKFGPYTQKSYGNHTHFYQLIYKKNQQIRYPIGNKFGFVCEVVKKINSKQIQNKVYQRIQGLRDFAECEKSTANLILKFKQLGIGEEQIDFYDDQSLLEIIQSSKDEPLQNVKDKINV